MKVRNLHDWQISVPEALDLQRRLAAQVSTKDEITTPRFIAGVDVATPKPRGMAIGAVVVLQYPELRIVETKLVQGELTFPYVPGLLSFREAPLVLTACQKLTLVPDLIFVDGQGVAHPRRFGLASHLGLFLDTPTIGCAKSLLCGSHDMPGESAGSYAELADRDETIGVALRTKLGVKPIYISTGHKIGLQTAIHWVLECCRGYRLPEPTRLAHLEAGGGLGQGKNAMVTEAGYQQRFFG